MAIGGLLKSYVMEICSINAAAGEKAITRYKGSAEAAPMFPSHILWDTQ